MRLALAIAVAAVLLPLAASAHTYGSNFITAGTACDQDSYITAANKCEKSIDGNTATLWESNNGAGFHWVKYDLGVGVTKSAGELTLLYDDPPNQWNFKDFTLQYSDDGTSWTSIATSTRASSTAVEAFDYDNTTPHRYFRVLVESSYNPATDFYAPISELTLSECTDCASTSTATSSALLSPSDMVLTYLFFLLDGLWFFACVIGLIIGLNYAFPIFDQK